MLITELGFIIKDKISKWMKDKGVTDIEVQLEMPSRIEYGELSTPISFKIARVLGKRPIDVANEIIKHLRNIPYLHDIKIAGGGYINIYLDKSSFYRDYLNEIISKGIDFARMKLGEGLVRIEYTSVNPNKALHIGHARNVVLGVALSRLLSYVGYDIELLNYIDDTGVQVADLIVGFLYLDFNPDSYDGRFDQYCGDIVYVKSHEQIESSKDLLEKRKKVMKLIEEGNNVVASFTRRIAERVLRDQLSTCFRLGAEYDMLIWESDIVWSGMHKKGFEIAKKSPIVKYVTDGKYAGCWIAKVSESDEFDPQQDEVLIRSDGTYTYVGKDLIFALWKMGLLKYPLPFKKFTEHNGREIITTSWPDGDKIELSECKLCINIIGVEQTKPQSVIKRVISSIYGEDIGNRYIHYYYNLVKLSSKTAEKYLGIKADTKAVKMSGRHGLYINIDPLLDLMKERIIEIIKKGGEVDGDIENIAEKIAIACLKYKLLSMDRDKEVIFDVDEALDVTKESGAYILYSYARALSILRKADISPSVDELNVRAFNNYDHALMRILIAAPIVILETCKTLEVKNIPNYMYKIASVFNEFYEKNPVLKADEVCRKNRLLLVKAFKIVMELMAYLAGIPLVDRM